MCVAAAVHWLLWFIPHPLFAPVHVIVLYKLWMSLPHHLQTMVLGYSLAGGTVLLLLLYTAMERLRVHVCRGRPVPAGTPSGTGSATDSDGEY